MRDSVFIAALLTAALACGVVAARTARAAARWAIMRTLAGEW